MNYLLLAREEEKKNKNVFLAFILCLFGRNFSPDFLNELNDQSIGPRQYERVMVHLIGQDNTGQTEESNAKGMIQIGDVGGTDWAYLEIGLIQTTVRKKFGSHTDSYILRGSCWQRSHI